jgi:hypothetical protein
LPQLRVQAGAAQTHYDDAQKFATCHGAPGKPKKDLLLIGSITGSKGWPKELFFLYPGPGGAFVGTPSLLGPKGADLLVR